MSDFISKVRTLQWDDHRFYHQCRINQTLHFMSAISFLVAYGLLFIDPALAGIVGWAVGMVARQSGHIFFEPRGFDSINNATYSHKESIKVGYNMRRKGVLIAVWCSLPLILFVSPSLFGLIAPSTNLNQYMHDVGLSWLALGVAGLAFRTLHLFIIRDPVWGLAWACKILLDPFHNIATYWKAPLALANGQRFDPLIASQQKPVVTESFGIKGTFKKASRPF